MTKLSEISKELYKSNKSSWNDIWNENIKSILKNEYTKRNKNYIIKLNFDR